MFEWLLRLVGLGKRSTVEKINTNSAPAPVPETRPEPTSTSAEATSKPITLDWYKSIGQDIEGSVSEKDLVAARAIKRSLPRCRYLKDRVSFGEEKTPSTKHSSIEQELMYEEDSLEMEEAEEHFDEFRHLEESDREYEEDHSNTSQDDNNQFQVEDTWHFPTPEELEADPCLQYDIRVQYPESYEDKQKAWYDPAYWMLEDNSYHEQYLEWNYPKKSKKYKE